MSADAAAPAAENARFGEVDAGLLEPMERAAGEGDWVAVATLLSKGASLNLQASSRPLRRTVLHWAVWGGHQKVVRLVVKAIVLTIDDPAAQWAGLQARCLSHDGGEDGTTPLHLASERGHVEVAAMLLAVGVSPHAPDGYERTALDLAVDANNEEMVVALVQGGADVNAAVGSTMRAPLHRAVRNNSLAMCEVLLREGAEVDPTDEHDVTPLHTAAGHGFGHIISALAAAGANLRAEDICWQQPMTWAAQSPDPESSIRALVAEGVSPSVMTPENYCTVQCAALEDRVETLSVMLDVGVDPNHGVVYDEEHLDGSGGYQGPSLLFLGALTASERVVRFLLSAGANEGLPAFRRPANNPSGPAARLIPADVVGEWKASVRGVPKEELDRRIVAVRTMLLEAHFCRKGYVSVLRTRLDNGEGLTGGPGGAAVEDRPPQPQQEGREAAAAAAAGVGKDYSGSAQGGAEDVDGFVPEDRAWCRAAAWVAGVPSLDLFTLITDYL